MQHNDGRIRIVFVPFSGMQPYCPLLRASSEHIPIVRALRARRTVGCLPLIFHRPFRFASGFADLDGFPPVMLPVPLIDPSQTLQGSAISCSVNRVPALDFVP
jgi:hypothetical protein